MTSKIPLVGMHYKDVELSFSDFPSWSANGGFYRGALAVADVFGRSDIKSVLVVKWDTLCFAIMDYNGNTLNIVAAQSLASQTGKVTVRGFY